MKFTVTCLVSSVNSSLLSESEAVTKEIVVANPRATVQNLRATVAIQFRLKVVAFDFRFDHRQPAQNADAAEAPTTTATTTSSTTPATTATTAESAATVDFSDEKRLLSECGLEEGDHLTLLPKNYRPSTTSTEHHSHDGSVASTTTAAAAVDDAEGPAAKKPRTEGAEDGLADGDDEESLLDEEDGDDEEDISDSDDAEATAQNDLFEALRDVVPDLTVLRQEFLANPQAVMERIERNHPSLFQVITQNQETFISLMNNEQLTKAAQSMLHGGTGSDGDEENSLEWSMGDDDEEMDEETAEQMNALFQNYIAGGGGGDAGDFSPEDLAALEASGMQVGDVDDDDGTGEEGGARKAGGSKKSEREFILARVPSEEDEKKIQALTELGFTYEQCKLAFYMCHRSIDRASNMLFESPPEL